MLVSHHGSAMTNVHRLLPRLIVNRLLLQAVTDEPRPCCALGFVEERNAVLPLIALGLPGVEDLYDLGDGFRLGLQGAKARGAEILLLDFTFQGREPLQVALDPANDTYTFDNASNIVSTSSGRGFAYDGTNTRVRTSYAGVTTYEFRSAHGLLLAEWRKQSGFYDALKEHMHLAGKEVAEQRTEFLGSTLLTPSWMFLQPDANGSPISSTWAGGGLLFKENYQPYGLQLNGTATGYTNRAFAGKTQDKSDLIYMGGRYYNPLAARFLSIDPQEADPSDLHSLNRYAYANNNPYRYVDPDGHTPVDLAFFAIDAVRLGVAIYTGGDVAGAAVDLGMSAVGVLSPVPGAGQVLKTLRTADKVVQSVRAADHVVDSANFVAKGEKTFQTYTKTNAKTGEIYCGRTGGCGTPLENIAKRDANHHMNDKGFGPAVLDKSSTNSAAVRGREQMMIERSGGAKSAGGTSGNAINGIAPKNPNRERYINEAKKTFGE